MNASPNQNISIEETSWAMNAQALSFIRTQVFILEQSVRPEDEWDTHDQEAVHFLALNDQQIPIACARIIVEQVNEQTAFHIGRVAVLKPYRRLGVGRSLVQAAIDYCKTKNAQWPIFLNAQVDRQDFYEHLHFVAQGEIFMDANIPHREMWYRP